MTLRFPFLVLTGTLTSACPALAGDPQPLDACVATLGEGGTSALVQVVHGWGTDFRVVMALETDQAGSAPPARLVSYLAPGQKAEVGVEGAVGTELAVLEIGRVGDRGTLVEPAGG